MSVARIYTVDAGVFVNAFKSSEPGHEESHRFLALCQEQGVPLIEPTLLLPEVAAAIRRGTGDAVLANRFAAALSGLPHIVQVALDEALARQAAEVAAIHELRGSDAVYAAVALRFGSALVTLDQQQYERAAAVVTTVKPAEALRAWSI